MDRVVSIVLVLKFIDRIKKKSIRRKINKSIHLRVPHVEELFLLQYQSKLC